MTTVDLRARSVHPLDANSHNTPDLRAESPSAMPLSPPLRRKAVSQACLDTEKVIATPRQDAEAESKTETARARAGRNQKFDNAHNGNAKPARIDDSRNLFSNANLKLSRSARNNLAAIEIECARQGVRGAIRRAQALLACGSFTTSIGPETGNLVVRQSDGKPFCKHRLCKNRLCWNCSPIRAGEQIDALVPTVESLLDGTASDGRLRMLTLTMLDPLGPGASAAAIASASPEALARLDEGDQAVLADEARALWKAWNELRKDDAHVDDLHTCFACFELTYNAERDSFHPHLHVMIISPGWIDRDSLLATWQAILGYEVGGGQGGVDLREKDDINEAVKYPLKGLSKTIEEMPMHRAVEMVRWLRNKKLLRTYGDLRGVAVSEDDDETETGVDDVVGVDVVTGEVFALSPAASTVLGLDVASWTRQPKPVEEARRRLVADFERVRAGEPAIPAPGVDLRVLPPTEGLLRVWGLPGEDRRENFDAELLRINRARALLGSPALTAAGLERLRVGSVVEDFVTELEASR